MRAGVSGHAAFVDAVSALPDFHAGALLGFARAQKLLPWTAHCALGPRADEILPSAAVEDLRRARDRNAARVRALADRSREIQRRFEAESIGLIFLKGLTHGVRLYGDPARRSQGDIDVLVRRSDVRRAVGALGELGYDVSRDASTGQPLAEMLGEGKAGKLRSACTIGRGEREKVDLHWSIKKSYEPAVPAPALWHGVCLSSGGGLALPALCSEDMLLVLLLHIAADLRLSRCRGKLFLDLYLLCRSGEAPASWAAFLEARRLQGVERLAVNVLALFLALWCSRDELPQLREALLDRAHLIETLSGEEAREIVARPRGDERNRRWHSRIHGERLAERLRGRARDPSHSLVRLFRPRQGASLVAFDRGAR